MTFQEEIKNIECIIDCIEDETREYGYDVEQYMLELPLLLKELIELKKKNQTHNESIYTLTDVQKQKINRFKEEHNYHETCRDRYSLVITPNESFATIEIKCNICGQSENLTNWSSI